MLTVFVLLLSIMLRRGFSIMSTTKSYQSIPDNFLLRQVIVIHRHGDRAQLSRSLGNNYPENPQVTEKWKTVLPTEDNIKRMFLSAKTKSFEDSSTFDLTASVYDGRDNNLSPYSQLTDIGVQQMVQVGEQLRQRYSEEFLPKDMNAAAEKVYLRSTNMCRTLQSLRSLLSGLFSITTESDDFQKRVKALEHQDDRLAIEVLPNTEETMYPQADGPCAAMVERRKIIFPPDLAARTINGYNEIEKKIRNVLGFTDRIDWMTSKEVLTCHTYHGIDYIKGLNSTDIEKVTEIAGWTWGVLYKDDILNRLAIGRFLTELLSTVEANLPVTGNKFNVELDNNERKRMLIFSGHDSTLVPVMSALGIYDDVWPPYASYLTLEIATDSQDELYVRAVYNNEDRNIIGYTESVWCPYNLFLQRVHSISITRGDYKSECEACLVSDMKEQQAMEAEIAATIGGLNEKKNDPVQVSKVATSVGMSSKSKL